MANMLVTNGGIAAIRNAQATGTNKVTVTSVKIGSGQWTPTGAATNLKTIIKTYTAIAGGAVGDNVIHVEAMDTSTDAFTAYEVGIFLSDGTLLAVASDTTAILTKAASAQAMLAVDLVIADASSVQFVFPSATFSVPPATTTIQGVVELATDAEALAGTDAVRAITPKTLKTVADTKAPVNHASNATTYGVASGANYGHSKLSDSISSTSSASGGVSATPKAVKDAKEAAIAAAEQADTARVAKAGDTVTGAIHSTCGKANTSGAVEQFGGEMAASDKWRVAAGATASDSGYVALDTADNGSEPILVRQYSGNFATLVRQAALLDGSGRTSFPVKVTCPEFAGDLTGNAQSATKLQTARNFQIKDHDQSHSGAAVSFNGTGNAILKLPATITASLNGNASTATSAGKATNDANGSRIDSTYLKLAGGTVTGTLVLSRTTDTSGTADNGPALVVGGTRSQAHIEIDNNEIMAKSGAKATGALYINGDGGAVYCEGTRVAKGASKGGTARGVYSDGNGVLQPMSANVGGTARGVYLKAGTVTAMSGTVGGANQPAFLEKGVVKACNNYSTISMVPSGNPAKKNLRTTYSATSNGYVVVLAAGGYVWNWTVTINGFAYSMHQTSYGSGNPGEKNYYFIPCRKGWSYRCQGGDDNQLTLYFMPCS